MESAREILGGQKMAIIEGLYDDLRHAHKIIDDLLCLTGRPGICFACARPIMQIQSSDKGLTERANAAERTVIEERCVSEGSGSAPLVHIFNYNGERHRCSLPIGVAHE